MNREQAKARVKIFNDIYTNQIKQWYSKYESKRYAFNLINAAEGHNGIEKHWDVFCHFAEGGDVEIYGGGSWHKVKDFNGDSVHQYRKAETKEMEIVQMLSELLVKFNDASENEVCSSIRFENKIRADLIAAILKQISKH